MTLIMEEALIHHPGTADADAVTPDVARVADNVAALEGDDAETPGVARATCQDGMDRESEQAPIVFAGAHCQDVEALIAMAVDPTFATIKREEDDSSSDALSLEGAENVTIKIEDDVASVGHIYACGQCDFTVLDGSELERHLETHTTRRKPAKRKRGKVTWGATGPFHTCEVCGYKTRVRHNMNVHRRIHTGEKPYACKWCDYRTRESGALGRHMKIHTGDKPHECPLCDYKTAHSSILQTHLRTHTGEKPFNCKVCDYKAARSDALRQHMKVHAIEKPYQCTLCDFRTKNNNYLRRHLRTHTGERPYACNQCEYRATEGSALKRHMTTHTGQKQYSCYVCSYMTDQATTLKLHVRKHTGEKPYACELCDYRASRLYSVHVHMKSRHQMSVRLYPCSLCNFVAPAQELLDRHKVTHHHEGTVDCTQVQDGGQEDLSTLEPPEPAVLRSGLGPPIIDERVKEKFLKRLNLPALPGQYYDK